MIRLDPLKLVIFKDGKKFRETHVKGEMLLGRDGDCQIVLPDQSVSRKHISLNAKTDHLELLKRSEFGPVWVNGKECTQAIVKIGDIIKLGPFELELIENAIPQKQKESIPLKPSSPASIHEESKVEEITMEPGEEVDAGQIQFQGTPMDQSQDPAGTEIIDESKGDLDNIGPSSIEMDLDSGGSDPQIPGLESNGADQNSPSNELDSLQDVNQLMEQNAPIEMQDQGPLVVDDPTTFGDQNEFPQDSESVTSESMIAEDAQTRVASASRIIPKLVFNNGEASVEEYEVKKDDVVIGRSKSCDIVIMDKKSSRRNTSIERMGVRFVIKDLDSSNGTYVNGVRITEKELSGDDEVRIGDTRFHFRVVNRDFEKKKSNLQAPSDIVPPPPPEAPKLSDHIESPTHSFASSISQHSPASPSEGMTPPMGISAPVPGVGLPTDTPSPAPGGIPGIGGPAGINQGDMSLLEKYRALPERKRMLYLITAVVAVWFFFFDEEPSIEPKKEKAAATETVKKDGEKEGEEKTSLSFESLPKSQQEFIENQYQLSSNLYYNKEYDKALFEVQKIFQLVSTYKNAREIQRYAEEGKRRMEAKERERRRKLEEEKLQAEIRKNLAFARGFMKSKQFDKASALFPQILSLDPENKEVARWQSEIEAIEEEKRLAEQQARVQDLINQQGMEIYDKGNAEFDGGRFPASISTLRRIEDIGVSDGELIKRANDKIVEAETKIKEIIEPLLVEAKSEEDSGNFESAYKNYQKVNEIDDRDTRGLEGMNRIKGILQEKVKVMYTEAVLSESYSDFENARKLYQKCVNAAPEGDLYQGRCQRKLERYKAFDFAKEEDAGF